MRRLLWLTLLGSAVAACGGTSGPPPTVIVETGSDDAGPAGTLDELVRDDALAAAEILTSGLVDGDPVIAGWCAVYARRLGIEHDRAQSAAALRRAVGVDDALLQALGWRWLAADAGIEPPDWGGGRPVDPAVGVFAALALARRGALPDPLASALGLPSGKPRKGQRPPAGRVEQLHTAALALDDGPLASVIAFAEARREPWIEAGPGGRQRWVAERLRGALIEAVLGPDAVPPALADSPASTDVEYSALAEIVVTPLLAAPPEVLRGAVLKAEGGLRIGALRALAVTTRIPRAGDFGACAAALKSDEPLVRVEAARTYLLLTARATE